MANINKVTTSQLLEALTKQQKLGGRPVFDKQILGKVDFNGIKLEEATFATASFTPGQQFREAQLPRCKFGGDEADIAMPLHLYKADFYRANLSEADFRGVVMRECSFVQATLTGTNLSHADCAGCDFTDANMEGADLTGANLYLAKFNRTKLSLRRQAVLQASERAWRDWYKDRPEQAEAGVPRLEQAASIYLELRANFLSIGAYSDASWAYVQERRARRAQHLPWVAAKYFKSEYPQSGLGQLWFKVKHVFLLLADALLLDAPTVYGESLGRTFLSLLFATVFVFPLLYSLAGGIKELGTGSITHTWITPLDAYILMLFSFGNLVQGYPGYDTVTEAGRVLRMVEQFFGLMMIGVLGFVLGRKINRG